MTTGTPAVPLTSTARVDHVFPVLTPAQVGRIAPHGRARRVREGEVLVEPGEPTTRFFVVSEGQVEAVRPGGEGEAPAAVFGPGQFTGEVSMLSGRRGLAQIRAAGAGEVIEVARDALLTLIQTDGELSDVLMR